MFEVLLLIWEFLSLTYILLIVYAILQVNAFIIVDYFKRYGGVA